MRRTLLVLPLFASALLTACGSGAENGANSAQPTDAAVAEGSIDDRMTDIDAAQADGTPEASGNATAQPTAQPARRVVRDSPAKAEQDAEAVAAE